MPRFPANSIETPFLLLCEEDFELTRESRIERFLDVPQSAPEFFGACQGGPATPEDNLET